MNQLQHDDSRISDGVHLLISLLVRYPEIGTISFEPGRQIIKFSFLIQANSSAMELSSLPDVLKQNLNAYHRLADIRNPYVDIKIQTWSSLTTLTLLRDIQSLQKGEIELTIALLKERVGSSLVKEENQSIQEEELLFQEEVIDNVLENVQKNDFEHRLYGIREEGRVMVFNK